MSARALALAPFAVLALGGCPSCPTGSMSPVGTDPHGIVHGGDSLAFQAEYGDWTSGPGACGGHWYVQHVEGGADEVGHVDNCGHYTAPATFAAGSPDIVIEASQFGLAGSCADCCPYATTTLVPQP
jgi:hypothetical protein